MITHLQPMTLGEILDRTFQMYRSRFRFFLAIGALPPLATLAVLVLGRLLDVFLSQTTLAGSTKLDIENLGSGIPLDTWMSLFRFAAWPLFVYASAGILFEQNPAFRVTVTQCAVRWRSWIAVSLLLWATWNGIPVLMYRIPILERARLNAMLSFSGGLSSIGEWPRSLFFLWAGWLVALVLSVTLWFCVPVWMLEPVALRSVLARGRALVKRARRRIATTWFLLSALGWILAGSVSFLLVLLLRSLVSLNRPDHYFAALRATLMIPEFTVPILVAPLFPIALTLFYYDQRIRREGFDIEWMMHAAGMNTPPSTEPAVAPVVAAESGEPFA